MKKKKNFRNYVKKHLRVIIIIAWALLISLIAIGLTSCGIPEGYKKDVVWHRITNVEVINMLSTTPPFERYKLTIDDTIKYISIKEYHVGDSVPFIYITPNNIIK
jgi:hypothetical protein